MALPRWFRAAGHVRFLQLLVELLAWESSVFARLFEYVYHLMRYVCVPGRLLGTQYLHCLDLFGASQRVGCLGCALPPENLLSSFMFFSFPAHRAFSRKCWNRAGYVSWSFDLLLSDTHDITTFGGVLLLLQRLLELRG